MKARSSSGMLHAASAFLSWSLLLLLCCISTAWAQHNTIESVSATDAADKSIVRIKMDNPVSKVPYSFMMKNPDRIALDFIDTSNATGKLRHDASLTNLSGMTVTQAGKRVRVVLDLRQATGYTTSIENNTVVVSIHHKMPAPAERTQPARKSLASYVNNIGFRADQTGQGFVTIELSDNKTPVNILQQDNKITAEFLNARLSPDAAEDIAAHNALASVQTVQARQSGRHVVLTIHTTGKPEYSAYQAERQVAIEVARAPAPKKTPPPVAPPPKVSDNMADTDDLSAPLTKTTTSVAAGKTAQRFTGAPLSLNFQNIEVRTILQVIADFTGLNVIASDTVTGTLTMRLKNVPWDQALDIVMQARNLDMRRNGSVLWIAPKEELLQKEKMELEQQSLIRSLEPLHAEVFQLNYQKVDEFRKSFGINEDGSISPDRKNTVLSQRGTAVIDKRTNQIFVTDTAHVIASIRKLIKRIDVPSRQVLIEARIVEASDDFSYSLGTRLGFSAKTNRMAIGNTMNTLTNLTGQNGDTDVVGGGNPAVNLPASGGNVGSFAISLFNASANRFLNLELSALEADGKGKILSSPRVITADQQAALIEQGEELPYQQATSSGATSTAFRKANLKLEVTPQITPDGNVILTVDVNKDSRGDPTPGGLAINTKHVKTQVQIDDGGTIVIGGIYTQTEVSGINKVPMLGDIPVLGHLFKNSEESRKKTELLIFLTPRVITEPPLPAK